MRILFIYQELQSFVKKDLDILRSAHAVRPIKFTGRKELAKHLLPDLWELWRGVIWCDATVSWFGKLHGFFAVCFSKIWAKKSVVIAGGDDATKYIVAGKPYGLFAHPIKKWFAYFTFRYADAILPVSKFMLNELFLYAEAETKKTKLIYHGFDPEAFKKLSGVDKARLVVTVGHISHENYYRKGLKVFVEGARLLPHIPFFIVGPDDDRAEIFLRRNAPPNVVLTGGLYGQELLQILSKATVYVQASEWESFGCSLAEAMLCECVPVVLNGTALPEVVGDCGFYVDRLEPEALAEKIKEALKAPPELGKRARQRIMGLFPIEKRRRELLAAIASLEK